MSPLVPQNPPAGTEGSDPSSPVTRTLAHHIVGAKAADLPPARLDGLIARMQRLLNVDGYEILTLNRNENKVELNVAKLKRQFDLD